MVARVRRIMRSRVPCRIWMAIFFTWHSSENDGHLGVKWKPQAEIRSAVASRRLRSIGKSEPTAMELYTRRCDMPPGTPLWVAAGDSTATASWIRSCAAVAPRRHEGVEPRPNRSSHAIMAVDSGACGFAGLPIGQAVNGLHGCSPPNRPAWFGALRRTTGCPGMFCQGPLGIILRYLPISALGSFHRDPAYISTYPELINLTEP